MGSKGTIGPGYFKSIKEPEVLMKEPEVFLAGDLI
jgi:hypothetical protein